jgi:glucose-6-phosphate 1-dehydrogenase
LSAGARPFALRRFASADDLCNTAAEEACAEALAAILGGRLYAVLFDDDAAVRRVREVFALIARQRGVEMSRLVMAQVGHPAVAARYDLSVLAIGSRSVLPSARIWFIGCGAGVAPRLREAVAEARPGVTWFVDHSAARLLGNDTSVSGIEVEEVAGAPVVTDVTAEPCAFVIFGGTGDLTRRKLVPALYNLAADGALPEATTLIGVSRDRRAPGELRDDLRASTAQFSRRKPLDEGVWRRLGARMDYLPGDFADPQTFARLRERLSDPGLLSRTGGNRLYYLAVPPDAFAPVLEQLDRAELLYRHQPPGRRPWCRVVVEKPFGHDLASARALNQLLARLLDESQIFRIDHYLAKETVQNILVFRFANLTFEPLWNRLSIDHVQITAAEAIGISGRGRFYEAVGVLRDVVQNHLLTLLSLSAAEVPVSFAADDVRSAEVNALRTVRPPGPGDVVRGQYRGYREEPGVAPGSRTATFLAVRLHMDSWRWNGVPFFLRAGKKLAAQATEIAIHFQPVPQALFGQGGEGGQRPHPNVLTLRIQPDEGISLSFAAKVPGDRLNLGNVLMNMSYADSFRRPIAEAYERLLLDVMRGDQTLFARRDLVEQAWRIVTPLLEYEAEAPLAIYEPGSAGPPEADALMAQSGRSWRRIG